MYQTSKHLNRLYSHWPAFPLQIWPLNQIGRIHSFFDPDDQPMEPGPLDGGDPLALQEAEARAVAHALSAAMEQSPDAPESAS